MRNSCVCMCVGVFCPRETSLRKKRRQTNGTSTVCEFYVEARPSERPLPSLGTTYIIRTLPRCLVVGSPFVRALRARGKNMHVLA